MPDWNGEEEVASAAAAAVENTSNGIESGMSQRDKCRSIRSGFQTMRSRSKHSTINVTFDKRKQEMFLYSEQCSHSFDIENIMAANGLNSSAMNLSYQKK